MLDLSLDGLAAVAALTRAGVPAALRGQDPWPVVATAAKGPAAGPELHGDPSCFSLPRADLSCTLFRVADVAREPAPSRLCGCALTGAPAAVRAWLDRHAHAAAYLSVLGHLDRLAGAADFSAVAVARVVLARAAAYPPATGPLDRDVAAALTAALAQARDALPGWHQAAQDRLNDNGQVVGSGAAELLAYHVRYPDRVPARWQVVLGDRVPRRTPSTPREVKQADFEADRVRSWAPLAASTRPPATGYPYDPLFAALRTTVTLLDRRPQQWVALEVEALGTTNDGVPAVHDQRVAAVVATYGVAGLFEHPVDGLPATLLALRLPAAVAAGLNCHTRMAIPLGAAQDGDGLATATLAYTLYCERPASWAHEAAGPIQAARAVLAPAGA